MSALNIPAAGDVTLSGINTEDDTDTCVKTEDREKFPSLLQAKLQ